MWAKAVALCSVGAVKILAASPASVSGRPAVSIAGMAARFVSTLWAGRRRPAGLPISQTRRRGRGNRAPKRVSTGLALAWHRHHQLQSPTDGLPEIARSKPSSPATGLETDGFPPDTTYRYQEVIARVPEGPQKSTRAIRWRARKRGWPSLSTH